MNIKMAINSKLSIIEYKKQQTSRTETESWMWRSFGGLLAGGKGENEGKGVVIKKYKFIGSE